MHTRISTFHAYPNICIPGIPECLHSSTHTRMLDMGFYSMGLELDRADRHKGGVHGVRPCLMSCDTGTTATTTTVPTSVKPSSLEQGPSTGLGVSSTMRSRTTTSVRIYFLCLCFLTTLILPFFTSLSVCLSPLSVCLSFSL